jgi:hypothetical protein
MHPQTTDTHGQTTYASNILWTTSIRHFLSPLLTLHFKQLHSPVWNSAITLHLLVFFQFIINGIIQNDQNILYISFTHVPFFSGLIESN